jgi:hypothetical protein
MKLTAFSPNKGHFSKCSTTLLKGFLPPVSITKNPGLGSRTEETILNFSFIATKRYLSVFCAIVYRNPVLSLVEKHPSASVKPANQILK